jgi:hypothetical protein
MLTAELQREHSETRQKESVISVKEKEIETLYE